MRSRLKFCRGRQAVSYGYCPLVTIPWMERTSLTLLQRLRDASDEPAWSEFLARYWRPLFVFARRQGLSEQVAEEVVQEVIVSMFQNRVKFQYDPARGKFSNYLFRIVIQQIALRRRLKTGRREVPNYDTEGNEIQSAGPISQGPEQEFDQLFEASLLAAMLEVVRDEVEPATFQAFELVTLHAVAPADAARITGLTRNAVYLAKKRILNRLRELGAPYAEDGELHESLKDAMAAEAPQRVAQSLTLGISERLNGRRSQDGGGEIA